MTNVLVVSEAKWITDEVVGTLKNREIDVQTTDSARTVKAVLEYMEPSIVVCDSHVGSMGAMALSRDIKSAAAMHGTEGDIKVVLLLDRQVDAFQARRALADAWLVKPLQRAALRWTLETLLSGNQWTNEAMQADLRGGMPSGETIANGPGTPLKEHGPDSASLDTP